MRSLLCTFAFFFLFASTPTHADTITTTLTGDGNIIIFPLYGETIPGQYFPRGFEFLSQPLNVIVNGTTGLAGLTFFDPAQHNGVDLLADIPFLAPVGYTTLTFMGNNLLSPFSFTSVLNVGTYSLTTDDDIPYILTVSDTPVGVPEPATWLLIVTGFAAALGFSTRHQIRRPQTTLCR